MAQEATQETKALHLENLLRGSFKFIPDDCRDYEMAKKLKVLFSEPGKGCLSRILHLRTFPLYTREQVRQKIVAAGLVSERASSDNAVNDLLRNNSCKVYTPWEYCWFERSQDGAGNERFQLVESSGSD